MQLECYDLSIDQWIIINFLFIFYKEVFCVVYNDQIYVLGGYNVQIKIG